MSENIKRALSIAGSDSGGGAGIQADLKTFSAFGVFGTTAITAITAQNTLGVHNIMPVRIDVLKSQIDAVISDIGVDAIKIGMLFNSEMIKAVSEKIKGLSVPIVIDPVMVAKGGANLLLEEAVETMIKYLIPLSTVLTPNIPEAEVLTGMKIVTEDDRLNCARKIIEMGAKSVVIKGGHRYEAENFSEDYFLDSNVNSFTVSSPRIDTKNTHGTGCTFSSAITANLALGLSLEEAVKKSKAYIYAAIVDDMNLGQGNGPTNHWAYFKDTNKYDNLISFSKK